MLRQLLFNVFLMACGKLKDMARLERSVGSAMRSTTCPKWNRDTFFALMWAYAYNERSDLVIKVYEDFLATGIKTDWRIVDYAVAACVQTGDLDRAYFYVTQLISNGGMLHAYTFRSLYRASQGNSQWMDQFDQMIEKQKRRRPLYFFHRNHSKDRTGSTREEAPDGSLHDNNRTNT